MPQKGQKHTKGSRVKMCKSQQALYNTGYVNPMKGKKRPDVSERNKKRSYKFMEGGNNPNKRPEVIAKRQKTIKGRTKEIYGHKGPENGNWRGGISFLPYTFEYNQELKYAIRLREKFKCYICKTLEKELFENLCIHHIDYDKTNNNPQNLVALCRKCHLKTNGNRKYWIEYFTQEFNKSKTYFSYTEVQNDCSTIFNFLKDKEISGLVPILRGGVVPAVILSFMLNKPIKEKPTSIKDVFVDEIVDFGMTYRRIYRKYPKNLFVCLYFNKKHYNYKKKPDFYVKIVENWCVFPWEERT